MLLDTSGLLSYLHTREPFHADAVRLMKTSTLRVTHNYVLAELMALSNARGFPRAPVIDFLIDLFSGLAIDVVFIDQHLHRAALNLLHQRPDKTWSLCDAVRFVLMTERGLTEALTTDRHFEQAGFIRLLAPRP
jgi:predicted nucleic acid-binding protein